MDEKIIETEVGTTDSENTIKIANDVVATIAGIAASEAKGVAGMSGGIAGGIGQMLGRKQLTKGVKVDINGDQAFIDILIIVEYGAQIPAVAADIQERVKDAVTNMTGLEIGAINVHVQGVAFQEEAPAAEEADDEE